MTRASEQPLPFDMTIETQVLGACLSDNANIDKASEILDPEHFYDPFFSRVFEMIVGLQAEGEVTPTILAAVMRTDPAFAEGEIETPPHEFFRVLRHSSSAISSVQSLARILRDLADRRDIIRLGEEISADAAMGMREAPIGDICEKYQERVDRIIAAASSTRKRRATSAADAIYNVAKKIEGQATAERPYAYKTNLDIWDNKLGGLLPGKVIYIGGRPGMAKSILAANISRQVAMQGMPVDYYSGEMGDDELGARFACEVDYDRCFSDRLKPLVYQDFIHLRASQGSMQRFIEAQMRFDDWAKIDIFTGRITLERVTANTRRRVRQMPGHRLIIIDTLQRTYVENLRRGANRVEEMTLITGSFKDLAEDLGATIIVLSQLSREIESRDDKHPTAADFRESGSIEQDADAIVGVVRPMRYAKEAFRRAHPGDQHDKALAAMVAAEGVFELGIPKNRSGPEADYTELFIDEKAAVIRNKGDGLAGQEAEELLF